jgi:hypothetical protein
MDTSALPAEVLNAFPSDSGAPRLPYNGIVAPPGQQAAPTAPDVQQNAPGIGALLTAQQPARPASPAPGSFGAKIAAAMFNTPGLSWSQKLVAGAVHGIAGNAPNIQNAVNNVSASIGDAAHATDNLKPGQGALSGVANVLAARNARQGAAKQQDFENNEKKRMNDALLAESHARLIQTNIGIQRQSEELRKASLGDSQTYVNAFKDAGYHVDDKISQAELNKRVAADPQFWETHTGGKTTEVPLLGSDGQPQKDPNGNIVYTPMYSVVDLKTKPVDGGNIIVTPEMSKYYKTNIGTDLPVGTQLTPEQFANQNAKAHQVADGFRTIEKDNGDTMDASLRDQLRTDLAVPSVTAGLNKYPGKPQKGIAEFRANADQHVAQIQQQLAALQQANPNDPQIAPLQQQLKQVQDDDRALNNVQQHGFTDEAKQQFAKDEETERHNRADEQIKRQQVLNPNGGALGNIPQSDGMIKQIADLRAANPSGARVLDKFDNLTQAALMSVAFGDGSVDFDKAFPVRLTKGAPGITAQNAIAVLKQINPNFSEQQYRATQTAYKDATTGKNAQAIQQYNNFIQHSSEAVDVLTETNRKGPKVWNNALNKAQNAGWGTEAIRIQSALAPVRGEISLLLSGGYKPGEDEQKVYHTILSDSATPAQISAALQQLSEMGTVRLDNINENYKRVTGKNLPRIIDQKTLDAAKHLGVSPRAFGTLQGLDSNGTIFGSQTPTGANQTQQQQVQQPQLPPAAIQQLKEGIHTAFKNGQVWTLQGGQPVQIVGSK